MKEDLISIIVLAYNAEKDILRCLKSIMNQTYKNIEIIIINDGSKDKTSEIIRGIKDPRIKLIERENKGTYYSRVEGYEVSTGKYIMYVDSDDSIEKNMIEVLYDNILKYKSDIVHCQNKKEINNNIIDGEKIFNDTKFIKKDEFEPLFFDILYKSIQCNTMWKQLFSREVLKSISSIDKKLLYGEDLVCNLEAYKRMKSIVFINDDLYIYKINNSGITKSKEQNKILQKIDDIIFVYKRLFDSIEDFKIADSRNYKEIVSLKMYYYLTINSYILVSYYTKKQFISYIKNILDKKEFLEINKYLNYKYKNINIKNKIIKKSCSLLMQKKLKKLYYFNKYIYLPLKKIKG